jgi:protein-disulfide isomerase
MKNPWIVIAVIALVLFGGSIWFGSNAATQNNEGVIAKTHIKGNPEATVKLVEYSDLQCPACASFQPFVKDLVEQYGESLSFEYKHFPLPIHPFAIQAAVAAEAAGQQDKFFEYHDLLFVNQAVWSKSATPQVFFMKYAEELELDMDKFKRHMRSSVIKDKVETQFKEGQDRGVTGTPTFFLNDEKMVFGTYEEFITQITSLVDPEVAKFLQENGLAPSTTPSKAAEVKFGL